MCRTRRQWQAAAAALRARPLPPPPRVGPARSGRRSSACASSSSTAVRRGDSNRHVLCAGAGRLRRQSALSRFYLSETEIPAAPPRAAPVRGGPETLRTNIVSASSTACCTRTPRTGTAHGGVVGISKTESFSPAPQHDPQDPVLNREPSLPSHPRRAVLPGGLPLPPRLTRGRWGPRRTAAIPTDKPYCSCKH